MRRFLTFLFVTLTLLAHRPSAAQVPQLMSYQGVITDNAGIIVPDGPHDLTFRIFNVDVGGVALFTEVQTAVPVVRGGFSVLIGSVSPLTLPFDVEYWLEVQVDGDAPLAPRVKLTSAAYSLMAKTVPDGAITTSKIATGAIFRSQVALNSLQNINFFDEPGVASAAEGIAVVSLDGTVQTIMSRSITLPLPGYVLVIGTGQANLGHANGTASNITFGVSDAAGAFPVNQDVAWSIPAAAPTGTYVSPVTVHGLFQVPLGLSTFYFLADENGGTGSVNDMQLSLVYIGTAYGTVTSTETGKGANSSDEAAPARSGLTPAEVANEQATASVFAAERLQRELERMQAEVAALRQQPTQAAASSSPRP